MSLCLDFLWYGEIEFGGGFCGSFDDVLIVCGWV